MPRFAYLFVSLGISLSTVAACKSDNPQSCELPANAGNAECSMMMPGIDASIDTPPACTDNSGCTTPAAPVCDLSDGAAACVECTATDHALCVDVKPICGVEHRCEACKSHSDCAASGVCLATGACAAVGDVAYVDAAGTDNTTCTKDMPCTRISSGLATQTDAGAARPFLKIKGTISEAVSITRNVTVFADTGASLTRGTNGDVLTVSGPSVVEIDDLTVTSSQNPGDAGIVTKDTTAVTLKRVTVTKHRGNGISCSGTSLTVSGSTISENAFAGIACMKGSLTLSSSTVTKNIAVGVSVDGASFDITNNFIYDNGDVTTALNGGALLNPPNGSTNRFEFNTVVGNHIRDFPNALTAGVLCNLAGFVAPNNIIAGNDINSEVDPTNANTAGKCTFPTSTLTASIDALKFVSPNAEPRNYHILLGSSAIGMATTPTTVTTDFDGDARTATANDQGADQFNSTAH